MKFGLFQVGLGLALAALAAHLGGAAWLLLWPAFAVGVVGVAYLRGLHDVFAKRPNDGRMSGLPAAALFPYVCVAWTLWQLKARLGGENAFDEVAPGVYVGRRPLNTGELPPDAAVVVDLTTELPRASPTRAIGDYRCLPTLDTAAPDSEGLTRLIAGLRGEAGPILFHCVAGHGRSATAAAALLIARGLADSPAGAVERLKAARPRVRLHGVQGAAVERFAATFHRDDASEDRSNRPPDPA